MSILEASASEKRMYPKVRVKEQEEYDDHYDFERKSLQSLKALESLFFDDFPSPDDSPTSVVRMPQLDCSNSSAPSVSVHKAGNRKTKVLEESITNSKATPVPRPRAVLSSPDNDGMIGSNYLSREEILSGLKNHNKCQNRHTKCKVISRPVAAEGSVNTRRELKEVAKGGRGLQARQRTTISDPSHRVNLRNGKSKSTQNRAFNSSWKDE